MFQGYIQQRHSMFKINGTDSVSVMYLNLQACRSRLEEAERELDQLEGKSENFSGTTDEETEMLETLKAQHEAVEAERKVRQAVFFIKSRPSLVLL